MPDTSLISLKGLTKPATVLIEKISGAIGVIYEPTKIRRKAQARADVAIVEAQTLIEVDELERRALARFVVEQGYQQRNIENITASALLYLDDQADPTEMDSDWISDFFEKCKRVSNEEMQKLWSRILAEEANNPNSVSKRTVDFVSTMDRSDADFFAKLCNFSDNSLGEPLIYDTQANIYNDNGLNFKDLAHLDSIGLINFNSLGYIRKGHGKNLRVAVAGKLLDIEFTKDKDNDLQFGVVMLTKIGQDLRKICSIETPDGFYQYVVERLVKKHKHNLSCPIKES